MVTGSTVFFFISTHKLETSLHYVGEAPSVSFAEQTRELPGRV